MVVPTDPATFTVETDACAAKIRIKGSAVKENGAAFLNIRSGLDENLALKRW